MVLNSAMPSGYTYAQPTRSRGLESTSNNVSARYRSLIFDPLGKLRRSEKGNRIVENVANRLRFEGIIITPQIRQPTSYNQQLLPNEAYHLQFYPITMTNAIVVQVCIA